MGYASDFDRQTCAIGVMAKAPRPGFSKTRLCPPLDPFQAADLSAAFLRDISENIALAGRETPISGYVAYAPEGQEALFDGHLATGTGLLLADGSPLMPPDVQGFGRCLLHAVMAMLARGHRAAVVVNSDSPTLPTSLLVRTAVALMAEGDRIVLGPAEDGGYYLLGMKAAHAHLFADIAWSTDSVAETTRQRAGQLGLQVVELPTWYDVDDEAALTRLLGDTAGIGGASDADTSPGDSSPSTAWPRIYENELGHDLVGERSSWARPYAVEAPGPLRPYPAPFTIRALTGMKLDTCELDLAAE